MENALLDGFLELHRNTCIVPECPSKRKLTIKSKNKWSKNNEDEHRNKSNDLLFDVIFILNSKAIKKYPNCCKLRLSHAFLLLDSVRLK
jgi:hypothetical protein